MPADDDPESEVFEITDFTTASEWERFVSRVEEVLTEWKLTESSVENWSSKNGESISDVWEEESEDISFADFKFFISHHFLKQDCEKEELKDKAEEDPLPSAMQDLLLMHNDFPPRAHCLVRWYGLREFVVITPGTNCEAIISESKCNLLLSSISIALANSGCQVPMFVQVQQKWRRIYTGECQGPGVRTDFEMVQLRKVPSQYNHLSGLLDIFKSKIGCNLLPLPPIDVSIRFTYILQDWQQHTWPQQPPDFDTVLGGEVGGVEFGNLPFGACEEPISELHLATTWPHLTKGTVVDNDVYSDLDPLQAPHWSVRVRAAENPQCLLGDFVTEFFKLCCRKESVEEVLGRGCAEEGGQENSDISSALSKLTEPAAAVPLTKLSVSSMVHSARKHIHRRRHVDESPLNIDILNSILLYLFPDAAVEKSSDNKPKTAHSSPLKTTESEKVPDDNLFLQLKAAPTDSLTHRLALCLCMVNYSYGGLPAVAHLWQEFVLELRYRWENNYLIYGLAAGPPDLRCCLLHQKFQMLNCCIERKRAPELRYRWENNYLIYGLAAGPPDLRCCLLHQKFQMLNCCIERKRARDEAHREGVRDRGRGPASSTAGSISTREAPPGKFRDSGSDSEDEFFECCSDQEEVEEGGNNGGKGKAEGRLHPYNNMTLLNSTEPLYVPVTQEPAPMTEDQLEEHSEVLAKLGTSAEGTHLRARMQSACLVSDMESFKAANPGCVLEDFVRWYSPRDYVENAEVDEKGNQVMTGELSARMKIPGNMWVEAWEISRVTPARRQKRLFDDTKEAEKVLHYLAMQKPGDLARHLLPCLLHAAIQKLKEEESKGITTSVEKNIQHAVSQVNKLLHSVNYDYKKLEDFIKQLVEMETVITRARSLRAKFAVDEDDQGDATEELVTFVSSLLEEPEVVVMGAGQGLIGRIIHRLFSSAQRAALLSPLDEDVEPAGESRKVPDFPPPAGREILLRTCVPRPAPYSKALPQRLFCVLMKDEFRLAGAFSSDTSFF
ncbi:rab3 GTPase-activating protein catalytic subunit [Austrofundulus limnaeus]|uniref:Rab3 GTPase-activating protein catalytic subunit n=1 Tax=Austrofundulus limnaeus TaxID=52670 RepID=A0A2I4BDT6_AUSLI|nr:PREDICTED: rab3 GTPase-activating protein catalytic subunit [Austrofundulus limnaeus]